MRANFRIFGRLFQLEHAAKIQNLLNMQKK